MKYPLSVRIVIYACVTFACVGAAGLKKQIRLGQRFAEHRRLIEVQLENDEQAQQEALALLAKIDGKVKFDPAHPKRVVGIDI
jgi:hypothetical protein